MMTEKRELPLYSVKAFLLISAFLSLVFVPGFGPSPGWAKKPNGDKARLAPAALLKWPENSSDYAILVDKSRQKVFLYHRNSPSRPEKTYACSTGENNGPKSRQNDRKTPEGIYFFTKSYVKKELAPIYGVRAFPIDYPNPIDKKEGRDGYGIWFHGTNKPLKPYDSNGCIVMENRSIDELSAYIKLHETPAIISSQIELTDPTNVENETRALERVIEDWRRAWEGKDIDRYMSLYSPRFTSGGKNWQKWKAYKAGLARKYKKIRVDIDNLTLLRSGDTVLAEFTQRYQTAGFRSAGVKRLYLRQNSKEWRIVGEFFMGKEKTLVALKTPPPSPSADIKALIDQWKGAWQRKDIKAYISCYDPGFRSRGMNLRAWKRHRGRLNRKYHDFRIDVSNLKIGRVSNGTVMVTFKQDYRADSYHDLGLKELFLVKKGKLWKIKEEEWRPLKGESRL